MTFTVVVNGVAVDAQATQIAMASATEISKHEREDLPHCKSIFVYRDPAQLIEA